VVVGRDFGNEIEVVSGIKASDWVIVNPSDSLVSGEKVRLATTLANENSGGNKTDSPQ
jgi:hypothetical protein